MNTYYGNAQLAFAGPETSQNLSFAFFFLTYIFLPPSRLYLICNLIFSSFFCRIKSLKGRNCLYLHLKLDYRVFKLVKNLTTKKLNKEQLTFYTIIQEIQVKTCKLLENAPLNCKPIIVVK